MLDPDEFGLLDSVFIVPYLVIQFTNRNIRNRGNTSFYLFLKNKTDKNKLVKREIPNKDKIHF